MPNRRVNKAIQFENTGIARVFLAFAACLAVAPWIIGSNFPFIRAGLLAVVLLMALISCARSHPSIQIRRGWWLLGLMLLAIGLGAIQSWTNITGGSILASASRARLAELILAVGVFVVAIFGFRTQQTFTAVFALIAINGFLISLFGIIQKLGWNGKIYWFYELIYGGVPFGPFVNRNNAAGYLLMCFAAATFFVARHVIRNSNLRSQRTNAKITFLESLSNGLQNLWIAFGQIEPKHLFQFFALVIIVCGILFSLSRGAAVALVVSVLAAWIMLIRFNRASIVSLILLVVCGGGIAVWVGQFGQVATRLESLADLPDAAEPRLNHWAQSMPYVADHWMTGSGLGTYRFGYPKYIDSTFESWFLHAENQYLETLAEVGVIGLAILLAIILILYSCCFSLMLESGSENRAVGIVGLVALTGQVVSSVFDFGLYQPGNAALLALLMAAVVARLNWARIVSKSRADNKVVGKFSISSAAILVLVAAATGWACYEHTGVDARRWAQFRLERLDVSGKNVSEQLDRSERFLEFALRIRPDDFESHYQWGLLHNYRYRFEASNSLLAEAEAIRSSNNQSSEEQAGEPVQLSPEQLNKLPREFSQVWPLTTLTALNRAAWIAKRTEPEIYQNLKADPAVQSHLTKAREQFLLAEEDCQWVPKSQVKLAELSVLFENPEKQHERLELALERWPTNVEVLFNAGLLEHHAANVDQTIALWRQCLLRTRKFDDPIFRYARYELTMRQFFEQLLPQDPEFLLRTANKYFGNANDTVVRNLLLGHTKRVLDADQQISTSVRSYLQAEIDTAFGQADQAEINFQRALEEDPENVEWRIAYVKLLQQLNRYDDAATQLRICSLQRETKYVRIIQRLITKNNRERKKALRMQSSMKLVPTP